MAALFVIFFLFVGSLSVLIETLLIAGYLVIFKGRKPSHWKGIKNYCSGLSTYFSKRQELLNDFPEIFWWWELRRLPYNILVGTFGILSSAVFWMGFDQAHFRHHLNSEAVSPYFLLCFAYFLGANIFFTAGWILESILRTIAPRISNQVGILSFHIGIIFSSTLTLLIPPLLLVLQFLVKNDLIFFEI